MLRLSYIVYRPALGQLVETRKGIDSWTEPSPVMAPNTSVHVLSFGLRTLTQPGSAVH